MTIPVEREGQRFSLQQATANQALALAEQDGIGTRFHSLVELDQDDSHLYEIVEFHPGDAPRVVCQWIESRRSGDRDADGSSE